MSLIRSKQSILTRLSPHNANSRFIVPNRQPGGDGPPPLDSGWLIGTTDAGGGQTAYGFADNYDFGGGTILTIGDLDPRVYPELFTQGEIAALVVQPFPAAEGDVAFCIIGAKDTPINNEELIFTIDGTDFYISGRGVQSFNDLQTQYFGTMTIVNGTQPDPVPDCVIVFDYLEANKDKYLPLVPVPVPNPYLAIGKGESKTVPGLMYYGVLNSIDDSQDWPDAGGSIGYNKTRFPSTSEATTSGTPLVDGLVVYEEDSQQKIKVVGNAIGETGSQPLPELQNVVLTIDEITVPLQWQSDGTYTSAGPDFTLLNFLQSIAWLPVFPAYYLGPALPDVGLIIGETTIGPGPAYGWFSRALLDSIGKTGSPVIGSFYPSSQAGLDLGGINAQVDTLGRPYFSLYGADISTPLPDLGPRYFNLEGLPSIEVNFTAGINRYTAFVDQSVIDYFATNQDALKACTITDQPNIDPRDFAILTNENAVPLTTPQGVFLTNGR